MKLSAKFARQETEAARHARIGRRRIPNDRLDVVRRMLNLPDAPPPADGLPCPDCDRRFKLATHLARHQNAKHPPLLP
jgi:hypothetical protein